MPNAAIPRDEVHRLSEACANEGLAFQAAARRLLEDQARLTRFFKSNLAQMKGKTGEVSLYLLAVVLRIFERSGGKLAKVTAAEIEAATSRITAVGRAMLPAGDDFPERVRAVAWRAQPGILDEALHALFERDEKKAEEVDMTPDQAALVFFMLWAATEALDAAWTAPAGGGDA
jgi:hypothetical protein